MAGRQLPGLGVLVPHPPSKPPDPRPASLSQSGSERPDIQQSSQDQSIRRLSGLNRRKLKSSKTPSDDYKYVAKEDQGSIFQQSFFSQGGDKPKVQKPYQTVHGQIPRKLEIERRRREYLKLDFEQLLAEKGIFPNSLIQKDSNSSDDHVTSTDSPLPPYLSLEIFDNEDYDCWTPEDWLSLGITEGSPEKKPVPAKALLPTDHKSASEDTKRSSLEYCWHLVGVLDYSKEKCQYLVQKVHPTTNLTDETRYPVLDQNNKSISPGVNDLQPGAKYWVPRIRLFFFAEDPRVFVERIQFALNWRKKTEALILYHLSVDCMPIWKGTPSLDAESLHSITKRALSAPGLRLKMLEKSIGTLQDEIKLRYNRTMNRTSFDSVVMGHPEEFSYITLPQRDIENVPEKGCFPAFEHFKKNQMDFFHLSLLTEPEVISRLSKLWSECNKVATMRLFNVSSVKPLRLDEFEAMQSQLHTRIDLHLREAWVAKLTNIFSNLQSFSHINEQSWEAYKHSKLYSLMALVRFKMKDSLRFLVQDSLTSLNQLMLETCHSVLACPKDLVWGNNLILSPYKPKNYPVFQLDLVLDQTGVHYSTSLEKFETSIIDLFDKAIRVTYNVPQLDKIVMPHFYVGDHLLESVSLLEPEVIGLREQVRNALIQAAIPLNAYAAEYEKYLELHNLDIETLLKSHTDAEQTSVEVKREVENHLKEKDTIEQTLPSSIVIGPFIVRVEAVRQALVKKRMALVKAVLDHHALKICKQIDNAFEECNVISRKLRDKPNSVEELTEKREWMKEIPEQMKSYKEHISMTLAEYEILEEFNYCLPDDDFKKKWTAIAWPQRIMSQMEETVEQNMNDEQRFHKIQLVNQNDFDEQQNSLKMLVAGFASHSDIHHAHEVANEVRRIRKQLKLCQTMAETYNTRQLLFGMPVTSYDWPQKLLKDVQPFKDLWSTTSNWLHWHESWLTHSLSSIDIEQLERNVKEAHKTMQRCVEQFKDIPGCHMVAREICNQIEDFRPHIPLVKGLGNPGMRGRHWQMLFEWTQIKVGQKANLTLSRCLELGLQNHLDHIIHVAEIAVKEFAIEQMQQEWSTVVIDMLPYKETGTYILKSLDEASQLLDDHIIKTQSLSSSSLAKSWESKLRMTQDVLEELLRCQISYLCLEPIFGSDDINQQLPLEEKRFQQMEQTWRRLIKRTLPDRKVIELCTNVSLQDELMQCNRLLEQMQKGLSEYLETKRGSFPRFCFLSDSELLEILSQTEDPTAVQPHLHKCFENIAQLKIQSDLQITHMYSGEGEEVKLLPPVSPAGRVEQCLRDVEKSMKATLRDTIDRSIKAYPEQPHAEWVLLWPGQVVIAGHQVFWTAEMSEALKQGDLAKRLYPQLQTQLDELVQLVRGQLSRMQRAVLSALIIIEVHAKDIAARLVEQKVSSTNDFEWISQLRYYWARDDLYIRAVNAEFSYGYEYLGNSGRLVITPLTERCYLALTGALQLKFGGALAGPAGTGRTETTKDLGKALAIHTVVFNCSDQLHFITISKFLKGIASSGAWICFDDFDRVDVAVLSVVAQQITDIQKAQQQRAERFVFAGTEIPLVPTCGVFITMSPGYAGRTELPNNLKSLFRPVAMMVPDYEMITEISLYSMGFVNAKVLSKKIITTFKLSSELLISQDHYDFGMRAVKAIISAAGNLKRENLDMNEDLICLRVIQDVNVPKLLQEDLKLFHAIVSDLFPETRRAPISYGTLEESIRNTCNEKNLKDVDGYISKCIQLYETTEVRHGLILVGPPGSGKTKCYETLGAALTALKGEPSESGGVYEAVQSYVFNPKSITIGQLYGEYDLLTQKWKDGIFSSLLRRGAASTDREKKWYMFDGPVDTVWIENMNTVLDDNKKLCLGSGEVIKLTDVMTMIFEVQDLAGASPATVSRCGMVYLEPSILGLISFTECWLKQLPEVLKPYTEQLNSLFDRFLQDSITFVRSSVNEVITSLDSNLVCSLLKLMDCFFHPFDIKEVDESHPPKKLDRLKELIEPWFFFSLVWSVGATGDACSFKRFSSWLKNKMAEEKVELCFPDEGLVYDYWLDDAGISKLEDDDEEEKKNMVQWVSWMDAAKSVVITPETNYVDIIVPTAETVRLTFLMDILLTNNKPVLCVGPTGTGKTLIMSDKLLKNMSAEYITHSLMFSASTSANHTQDYIDSKLCRRGKDQFGPPTGKNFIFFIDDLNMPMMDTCGALPPIELLRQWMDHQGWYDRKQIGMFKHIVDISFACAMGLPCKGQNQITQRFTRHFNILSFTDVEDGSKKKIFSTILGSWMGPVPAIQSLNESLVDATIRVYSAVTSKLLPTPAKSHYTFNLRDLSKVFQGILMAEAEGIEDKLQLLQLWYHESCRVFQDRLVCSEDRDWFNRLLKDCIKDFDCNFEEVVPCQPVLFGDFMNPGADTKVYTLMEDKKELEKVMEEYMRNYDQTSTNKIRLVYFMDAIEHVCRISRILRQPLGNALLLGVGGSGRRSLTKLASYMSEYECFQIKLTKNYGQTEWREEIKSIMLKAGLQDQQITFLFIDTQIKCESFLEDINNILKFGDVPNLYASDEQERILAAMEPVVQDLGQQPTKANLMAAYIRRVRRNIHIVLCMSPVGEVFRARLRQFPSLVTCCTIDWFSAWPEEALQALATLFLNELTELVSPLAMEGLKMACVKIHQSVAKKSEQYLAEVSRHSYVTPKSYLELLKIFSKLSGQRKQELCVARQRMESGLDKLLSVVENVSEMQEELETMRPEVEKATRDIDVAMETITKETKVADETRQSVQAKHAKAFDQTRIARAIAADAQRDLDEALVTLNAAHTSLKSLTSNDITEVQAMQESHKGVKLVIEALCIMKGIEPKMVPGEKPGTEVSDYWESGKDLLQDPGEFLDSLIKYDKDNIPDNVICLVQPYIDNKEFEPASIANVSKACTSICQWVRAMHKYHFVAKAVEPKRKALQEAQQDLVECQRVLNIAKEKQSAVEGNIASLQAKYQKYLKKKDALVNKHQLCEARLVGANKLIGILADEKIGWKETLQHLDYMVNNVAGDVLLSAGCIAYLGPFTAEYRAAIVEEWLHFFKELNVPHTDEFNLISTLGDPVQIHSWQVSGLPKDNHSVENGVIAQYSLRWTLFIDPEGQASTWIKNMERNNGLVAVKLSDQDFLSNLQRAICFGRPCLLENVGEELYPALEPVLLQKTFKQQGSTVLQIGDSVITYHESFKMYMTTRLANPRFSPEVSSKVTFINFFLSPSGLEEHLLSQVVAEKQPELEETKNRLIISNAKMKQELREIEDEILFRLSSAEGNTVDNKELIQMLEASKIKAGEIKAIMMKAKQTEQDNDAARLEYLPVAQRTQILFFCLSDMSNVDPMYKFSLKWFLGFFMASIANSKKADTVEKRVSNINDFFTFSLYSHVSRSLFEKHKLMFAFLLCTRIMMSRNQIYMAEWHYLLFGGRPVQELSNPAVSWLPDSAWQDILGLSSLDSFRNLAESFDKHLLDFKRFFDSDQPHREPLPGEWDTNLDSFQKLLVLRCLRSDCLIQGLQDFVSAQLGQQFIEPQTLDLSVVFKESSPSTPIIFISSPGADPAADLYKFADVMHFSKKMSAISLGEGQVPLAENMMHAAMERGHWVFLQNCHLVPSWMPSLERLIESIDPGKVHKDFRLWLTTIPSNKFPVSILQNGSKINIEPLNGIKANVQKSYLRLTDDFISSSAKEANFKSLLLSLCFFHGIALERRKFGPLGFNIPYEFTDRDLDICISQLKMFLDQYQDIPYKLLKYTAGEMNYGGRVTDDWDRRCLLTLLEDFYCPAVLHNNHVYSSSGVYRQLDTNLDIEGYLAYIRGLPVNSAPEIFGLHGNAHISFGQNETFALLGAMGRLQPQAASVGDKTLEETVEEIVADIIEKIPQPFSVQEVKEKYPALHEESMNTVLIQEVIRYNKLLRVMSQSLSEVVKALRGSAVMSSQLELVANSLFNNVVPDMWKAKAYPSLKPLASWVSDLLRRINFLQGWIYNGIPPVFWISGLFSPQAFLTGTLQNHARRSGTPIDTIGFDFEVMAKSLPELTERPNTGCYIHGLFLEGARWDPQAGQLAESRPRELHTEMPVIWLVPKPNRNPPTSGVYVCPIYKTLTRAGTLSTTGQSTNFVTAVELPTDQNQRHWIKRGVALFCALDN